jgi:hypothetical protein
MKNDLSTRIRQGCRALNLTISGLARSVPMKRQHLQMLLDGSIGRSKYLPDLARVLGCDATWLITGCGVAPSWWPKPAEPEPPPAPAAAAAEVQDPKNGVIADQAVEIRQLRAALQRAEQELAKLRAIAGAKIAEADAANREVERLRDPAGDVGIQHSPTGTTA